MAERCLEIARDVCPQALRVLGGIHATFMYQQVLTEAPYIDVIVRGEGEEIIVELARAFAAGNWKEARAGSRASPTSPTTARSSRAQRRPPSRISMPSSRIGPCSNGRNTSMCRLASGSRSPIWLAAALHLFILLAVEVLARLSHPRSEESGRRDRKLVNDHQVGFFILADEEPTINRKKLSPSARN